MAFRHEIYSSPYTGSIGDLIGRESQIRANAARTAGDARARAAEIGGHAKAGMIGAATQGGQAVLGNIGQILQQRRDAPRIAAEQQLAMRERLAKIAEIEQKLNANRASEDEGEMAKFAIRAAMETAKGDHGKAADWLLSQGWAQLAEQVRKAAPPAPKPAEPYTLNPGDVRFGPDNAQVASVSAVPKPVEPLSIDAQLMEAYRTNDRAAINRLLAQKREMSAAGRAPEGGAAAEPLVPIVGPDGQPILVPRSQAVNQRPASTREQGRQVTSGDANRIAELDTSLNDLATLAGTLSETEKATGTAARVGASLWNPITELTGWGEEAKKRQGVIDRVKQVIGKALEGGVLRKEDEYKYTKILPTIGDTQAVAASKLEGLRKALIQRRETTLDALEDSNYDVSKHRERTGAAPPPPAADPLGLFK